MALYQMLVWAKSDEDFEAKDIEAILAMKPDFLAAKGLTTLGVVVLPATREEFLEWATKPDIVKDSNKQ